MGRLSRASLFAIHRWLGLNCGVVLFVICFSGTIATLGPEIDWLIDPRLRVHGDGPPLSLAALADRVMSRNPDWSVNSISASQPGTAYQLEVERSDGKRERLLIHPWTGEILGPTSPHRVRTLFRVFHKQFYLFPGQGLHGTFIVGLYGFILLLSGITGLCSYKRFWAKLFVLRRDQERRVFWRDLHRLLGVWSSLLLILWASTGIWYFAARFRPSNELPANGDQSQISLERARTLGHTLAVRSIAGLVDGVSRERPDFEPVHLMLPNRPGLPLILFGQSRLMLSGSSTYRIQVDSLNGAILDATPAVPSSIVDLLDIWVDPLHFGSFGGLTTKILWFLFGLIVSALIPIGGLIWLRRTSQSRPTGMRVAEAASTFTGPASRSPYARWGSILFSSMVLLLAGVCTWKNAPPPSVMIPALTSRLSLGEQVIGPWTAKLERLQSSSDGMATFRVIFPKNAIPNFASADLSWLNSDGTTPLSVQQLKGSFHFLNATLSIPASSADRSVRLTIRNHDGEEHAALFKPIAWPDKADQAPRQATNYEAPRAVRFVFGAFVGITSFLVAIWFRYIG